MTLKGGQQLHLFSPLIHKRILKQDARHLSSNFEHYFFDGICTEPELGPFYTEKPYYSQVKDLIDSKLTPLYDDFFREAFKILKPNSRMCFISPIINTVDGNDLQVNIEEIAIKNKFRLVPALDLKRIPSKSNQKVKLNKKHARNLIDAKRGQYIKRKLYIIEK